MELQYKNPSRKESVEYIVKRSNELRLPLSLVLATVMIESYFRQFDQYGNTLKCVNARSTDYGYMMVNEMHRISKSSWGTILDEDWEKILYDWKYNLEFGLKELTMCYHLAYARREYIFGARYFKRIAKDEFLARAAWSAYNAGPKNMARYRTRRDPSKPFTTKEGFDERDIRFYKHWINCETNGIRAVLR